MTRWTTNELDEYGRRYPSIVPSIVAPQARAATLKLVHRQEET